jgi:FixJ family two-component response regulator
MVTVRKVFVVDDEPLVRRALKQSIESLGYHVVCFPSGELCLDALSEERCDLVITDLTMPGMDGLNLLDRIRQVSPLTSVLMVTGYGSVTTAVQSIQRGAVDFIEKPLDEAVLLPKIQALLELPHKADSEDLSNAEERILALVAAGKANKEIAYLLNRSVRTIENHRHRLMKKLGVASTAELVKVALTRPQCGAKRAPRP